MILFTFFQNIQAQQTKIFSLSPMTAETVKVNGMVVGLGHFGDNPSLQKINGLNVDLMLFSPLILMYRDPSERELLETKLISNGLNIGTGGYSSLSTVHNGLSIAMYTFCKQLNGVSINGAYTSVGSLNGLHISGIGNFSDRSAGINLGISNNNVQMTGLQVGIINQSKELRGIQIGVFNKSGALRGLQLGIWNSNAKRSLPFINF